MIKVGIQSYTIRDYCKTIEDIDKTDILEILKYASERLITDISTNASLITPEKVELLNQLNN